MTPSIRGIEAVPDAEVAPEVMGMESGTNMLYVFLHSIALRVASGGQLGLTCMDRSVHVKSTSAARYSTFLFDDRVHHAGVEGKGDRDWLPLFSKP